MREYLEKFVEGSMSQKKMEKRRTKQGKERRDDEGGHEIKGCDNSIA